MRPFKAEDKVYDIMRQEWGVVLRIVEDDWYPVKVVFGRDVIVSYTKNGLCLLDHKIPTIYHKPPPWVVNLPAAMRQFIGQIVKVRNVNGNWMKRYLVAVQDRAPHFIAPVTNPGVPRDGDGLKAWAECEPLF